MKIAKDHAMSVSQMLDAIPSIYSGHVSTPPRVRVWKDGAVLGMVDWIDTESRTVRCPVMESTKDSCGDLLPRERWEWQEVSYDRLEILFNFEAD